MLRYLNPGPAFTAKGETKPRDSLCEDNAHHTAASAGQRSGLQVWLRFNFKNFTGECRSGKYDDVTLNNLERSKSKATKPEGTEMVKLQFRVWY